jgi:hypothetical protein
MRIGDAPSSLRLACGCETFLKTAGTKVIDGALSDASWMAHHLSAEAAHRLACAGSKEPRLPKQLPAVL